jgi:cobalt-zinc-cadmium efflux system membrane fusion protein
VQLGDQVTKGQPLCRLKHPGIIEIQQDYLEAAHTFTMNEQQHERALKLHEENISSKKNFQKIQAEYMLSKGEKERLATFLRMIGIDPETLDEGNMRDYIDVYSPINGVVTDVYIHIGAFIGQDEEIMEVIDRSKLYVELMIFEKDIPRIRVGQTVTFTLANISDQEFQTRIFSIGGEVEAGSRIIRALAEVQNPDLNLYPGMFCASRIFTGGRNGYSLPESALVRESDSVKYVFTVSSSDDAEEYSFKRIKASTGTNFWGYVEILDPVQELHDNDVVIKGAYYVHSQMLKELE